VHLTLFWTRPQNYTIVRDENLDEVAQKNLQVIRQAWANMADTKRTSIKKNYKIVRSVRQLYSTCSRGNTTHHSL
jgi:hypothetical protein